MNHDEANFYDFIAHEIRQTSRSQRKALININPMVKDEAVKAIATRICRRAKERFKITKAGAPTQAPSTSHYSGHNSSGASSG